MALYVINNAALEKLKVVAAELALDVINTATTVHGRMTVEEGLEKLNVVACDKETLARVRHDFQHTPEISYSYGLNSF